MTTSLQSRTSARALPLLVALAGVALGACGDDPFQVIESVEFDPSLGIVLDSMEMLEGGVYIQDDTIGMGDTIVPTSEVRVSYVGYISDGSSFGVGEFGFILGEGEAIPGFEIGILGMNQGGIRRIIIPPELGYGDEERTGIPAGSVLIFDVTVLDVFAPDDPT